MDGVFRGCRIRVCRIAAHTHARVGRRRKQACPAGTGRPAEPDDVYLVNPGGHHFQRTGDRCGGRARGAEVGRRRPFTAGFGAERQHRHAHQHRARFPRHHLGHGGAGGDRAQGAGPGAHRAHRNGCGGPRAGIHRRGSALRVALGAPVRAHPAPVRHAHRHSAGARPHGAGAEDDPCGVARGGRARGRRDRDALPRVRLRRH